MGIFSDPMTYFVLGKKTTFSHEWNAGYAVLSSYL